MIDEFDSSPEVELNNSENSKTPAHNKKWFLGILIVIVIGCFLLVSTSEDEVVNDNTYRFVNNNSAICTHNFQQKQIECIDVDTDQKQTVDIPNAYKNLESIRPSHDGSKLLLSHASDSEDTRYVVSDTNFSNPQEIAVPYDDEDGSEIIWGSNSNSLIISKQIREENDADFLPAPLVVWNYDVTAKEARRIYKNGDYDEPAIKIVGASGEYLFITQTISKNWVATNTDPPADALLAVRLDDGFVRVVDIEQLIKYDGRNIYASGFSIQYDPAVSTFYVNGQNQVSDTDYQNYYAAAKLVDANGLMIDEISRLTSQESYYGITSTKGTLVADWSDESEGLQYSLIASPEETHNLQKLSLDKDNSKFVIASLPNAE